MVDFAILIITEIIAAFFLILGYMVRCRGQVQLLAGYDARKVQDPEGLGRWVGDNLLILGSGGLVLFLLEFLFPDLAILLFVVYMAGAVPLISVLTALKSRRFDAA